MSTAIESESFKLVSKKCRFKAFIRGAVQGVGFRPFVYRLAKELSLTGWICNSPQGVTLEAEGRKKDVETFERRLRSELPPNAAIHSMESAILDAKGYSVFEIRLSDEEGPRAAVVLPDVAVCNDCAREISDPTDRRFRYPFTNCTNCGPRYSIIEALPYDRHNTSMKHFIMCGDCRTEYEDPLNRRFHAQPNACPACGPSLQLWDANGIAIAKHDEALKKSVDALCDGAIAAVKGLGGFHLMADAANDDAVRRLRHRKLREEKPLAVMVADLNSAKRLCRISKQEEAALSSTAAPIVLLAKKRAGEPVSDLVAPGNPNLGVMLAYTPLHRLLTMGCGFPLIATSGNLSDEPICIDENEAVDRLGGIADLMLVHDRQIVRPVDDSVVRIMAGRQTVIRRARGLAPLPVVSAYSFPSTIAVGAHMKGAVAASTPSVGAVMAQHIGDLDTAQSRTAFHASVTDLERLYAIKPERAACDLHPDYFSTRFAEASGVPVTKVQHHHAHILSCMAENEVEGRVFGVAWDGTGYGTDGTVWGGEFLRVDGPDFERVAHLRQFGLPGGDRAVKEPRRSALGVLYEIYGEEAFDKIGLETLKAFSAEELTVLAVVLEKGVNTPMTSSAGRLFDAVASLTGVRQFIRFEGQAAMEMEFLTDGFDTDESYDSGVPDTPLTPAVIDWEPIVSGVIRDTRAGAPQGLVSARFHNTLAEMISGAAKLAGEPQVVLSGGCFQNKYLLERTIKQLERDGFHVYRHQRVPPNDGGIALGQLWAATFSDRSRLSKGSV